MQNKFTQKAQNTLKSALSEAGALGHSFIGSEHILLALIGERDSIAAKILSARGLTASLVRSAICEHIGVGEPCRPAPSDLTPNAKAIIEASATIAEERGCTYIGTEHLLCAILKQSECTALKIIKDSAISPSLLICDLSSHSSSVSAPQKKCAESKQGEPKIQKRQLTNLSMYTRDLNDLAMRGKIDPVIGREKETERIVQILCRRKKNNPCLIGEPGVGKTAIVEGLAMRIVEKNVPDSLCNTRILSLDITSMLAGAKYRGEFEDRMKSIMSEVERSPDIILFIDEMHVIVGAGAAEGAVDAANILKPALARGNIRVIGATTLSEYKKHIERDSALERRFGTVNVEEPTTEQALTLLYGLRENYQNHHGIQITDKAISAAVNLSVRFIHDRFLPDKAIDLIDEAAAKLSIASKAKIPQALPLENQLEELRELRRDAIYSQDFSLASELREQEATLKNELITQSAIALEHKKTPPAELTEVHIAEVISMWTGIPTDKILGGESGALSQLEERLSRRIIGQDTAICSVCSAIRRSSVGFGNTERPTGVFMFLGKSGVGKTELARAVAEELFGSKNALVRFDMSEYMEKHSASKLIGSPPGYVGYGDGGLLTEKVRRRPYCVLLLDEIEKAHTDIFNLLLPVFEDGKLTDSQGREVDFCNTVIIMTSNVGTSGCERISGFIGEDTQKSRAKESIRSSLKSTFSAEFLNRIDEVIVFDELGCDALEKIAQNALSRLALRANALGIELVFAPNVSTLIASMALAEGSGARNIRRIIAKSIEDKLSLSLLDGKISSDSIVKIEVENGDFIVV